jgi:hypothetical protein
VLSYIPNFKAYSDRLEEDEVSAEQQTRDQAEITKTTSSIFADGGSKLSLSAFL